MSTDSSLSEKSRQYYKCCINIKLERQIGSRYFVTAANASKIIFLKEAAVHFLKYTGKNVGNKLEREVYTKLQDSMELAQLSADAFMFYHVYADLVLLSKSNDLAKSSLDMNLHYLELKTFLQEIEHTPDWYLISTMLYLDLNPNCMVTTKDIIIASTHSHRLSLRSCLNRDYTILAFYIQY